MKKNQVILLFVLLGLFVAAGCATDKERQEGERNQVPTEQVTKQPEVKPTEEIDEEMSGQEVFPYELICSSVEETNEAKDGEVVYFTSKLYYPVFEGTYADNMNRFVESITKKFREALPVAEENAKYDYEDAKAGEFSGYIFPEAEELTVSCVWGKEQWQVLLSRCVSDSGGAHPNVYCKAYVVDMTTGSERKIESVLEPYGVTKEEMVAYATEQIKNEYGEDLYVFDDESYLEGEVVRFTEENQWFVNEKGLVVFANPYEITPYAYGMIECEISYEVLEEGLKNK